MLPTIRISQVQYVIDPGMPTEYAGNLSFSGSNPIQTNYTLDLNSSSDGFHQILIRVKDDDGKWSQNAQRKVFVSHPVTVTLSSLKYCFDGDLSSVYTLPLIPISNSPGLWAHSSELIPPPALAQGIHALSFWTVDTTGKISHRANRIVLISPSQLSTINRFEWFLSGGEADPAIVHSHTVVEPLSDITELIRAVLPDLTPETEYKLHLTARTADGKESLRYIYTFEYAWMVENLVITLNVNQFFLNWDEIPNADYYLLDSMSSPETVHSTVSVSSPPVIINPPHFQKRFFQVRAVMEE